MAIGWLAILKTVPWADVIGAAPGVVGGAKKLWDSVGNRPPSKAVAADVTGEGVETIASLSARTLNLEADIDFLQGQLAAASKLISALAEQNASLIAGVESSRLRMRWLAAASILAAALAVASLVLVVSRI